MIDRHQVYAFAPTGQLQPLGTLSPSYAEALADAQTFAAATRDPKAFMQNVRIARVTLTDRWWERTP
jgi:hypothetical protein